MVNMINSRQMLHGKMPWMESNNDPYDVSDDPYSDEPPFEDDAVLEEVIVPVFGRRYSDYPKTFWIDGSAEVLIGDVPESLTGTAFERTQAEYHGTDHRATPTFDPFDDDISKLY
jgi:hypothetical protein